MKAIAKPSSVVCTVSPLEPPAAGALRRTRRAGAARNIEEVWRSHSALGAEQPPGAPVPGADHREPKARRPPADEVERAVTSSPAGASGRAARRSAAIPDCRRHPAAGPAPPQQGRDRDLGLDARQLGAEAEMDAAAEGQRLDVGPGDVEPVRVIGIDRRVVVGRAQQAQHGLALGDAPAAEVCRCPPAPLARSAAPRDRSAGIPRSRW